MKQNCAEIGEAIKIPEFYRVVGFLLLTGLLIPSFGSFGYYFMLDVVELSKFTIAMLGVLGFVCMLIGSAMFKTCFANKEIRTLTCVSLGVGVLFAPLNLLFVLRKNEEYGLPDMFVIIFTDIVSDILSQCLVMMPILILFAKITPKRIEASTFAFLTGTFNMMGITRGLMGTLVNDLFIGVT